MKRTCFLMLIAVPTANASSQQVIIGGGSHSVVICDDSTAGSWGANYKGQLGDGTTTSANEPVDVSSLSGITAVAAGWEHSMALLDDGTVWAWGTNLYGQLGDSTNIDSSIPVKVKTISDVTAISWGHIHTHSLAVQSDGTAWAWGYNSTGKLGNNTTVSTNAPVQVHGFNDVGFLTNVVSVAGGHDFSLALKDDGTAWSWGANGFSQLGDGTTTQRLTPVQVTGLGFAVEIVVGDWHCMALQNDGTVWTWGYGGGGRLGTNSTATSATAVQVHGPGDVGFLTDIVKIAAGENFCLALKSDGTMWTWGKNDLGQCGDGSTSDRWTPVQVSGLTGIVEIGGGARHSVAVKNDGTIWAWGENVFGQLGDGTNTNSTVPVQVINHCPMASTADTEDWISEPLEIFPNPALDGRFTVRGVGEIEITGLDGKLRWTGFSEGKLEIDLSDAPSGLYVLRNGPNVYRLLLN